MITKFAENMALLFAEKKVINETELNVYRYGFEPLLSTVINCFLILIISMLMGAVFEALLFFTAFIPLRILAGGYHAKHHWSCILITNTAFFIFTVILRRINDDLMPLYASFATIFSSMTIWALSPVEAANKPLSKNKREILRTRSILLASANMAVLLIFMFIPKLPFSLFVYYISGSVAASFSLIAASLPKRGDSLRRL